MSFSAILYSEYTAPSFWLAQRIRIHPKLLNAAMDDWWAIRPVCSTVVNLIVEQVVLIPVFTSVKKPQMPTLLFHMLLSLGPLRVVSLVGVSYAAVALYFHY